MNVNFCDFIFDWEAVVFRQSILGVHFSCSALALCVFFLNKIFLRGKLVGSLTKENLGDLFWLKIQLNKC